ncbi:hypothetical protein [Anoxybacteroides tepidamans]|uniref:hypothetical protein n=1 Tax=Anoxybacteroides tepidamans TaxID=265948 RepID=UPI00048990AE|nr:hypothetical protein [Anoxybacillus tepidamans]
MNAVKLSVFENWRQTFHEALRQIIKEYYQTPLALRSAFLVIKLVEKHWKRINPDFFNSNVHYYIVLAQTTDYLLRFLSPMIDWVLLFEKVGCATKQVDIDIAYYQQGQCIIRKFILQEDEWFYSHYIRNVMAAFESMKDMKPQKIEFCSLFTGECKIHDIAS